ncbi:MAG: hypothetical protein AAFQ89_05115 [Cyanobacteria bacterium J06626_18]
MTRRPQRIVVKCHPDELATIQAKATAFDREAATYLRELGLAAAEPTQAEDTVQRQLYWLAGTLHDLLSRWIETSTVSPDGLRESMQLTIQALRVLQQEALLDKLSPHVLNANFAQAIAQVRYAYQSHEGQ